MTEPVIITAARTTWPQRHAAIGDLERMGLTPRCETRARQGTAPDEVAEILGTADVVTVTWELSADGIPVEAVTSWRPVNIATEPATFTETVVRRRPTSKEAAMLRLDAEQMVLAIRRIAADGQGAVVEVADITMAGDLFQLVYSWPAA